MISITRQQMVDKIFRLNDEIEKIEAATIERCAQRVQEYLEAQGYNGKDAAAAIRALKEKP